MKSLLIYYQIFYYSVFLIINKISSIEATKKDKIDNNSNTNNNDVEVNNELSKNKKWIVIEYVEPPSFLRHNTKKNDNEQNHRKLQERTCFPECTGMQAEDCLSIIEQNAPDTFSTMQYPRSFEWGRVVISVDDNNNVKTPPSRG